MPLDKDSRLIAEAMGPGQSGMAPPQYKVYSVLVDDRNRGFPENGEDVIKIVTTSFDKARDVAQQLFLEYTNADPARGRGGPWEVPEDELAFANDLQNYPPNQWISLPGDDTWSVLIHATNLS